MPFGLRSLSQHYSDIVVREMVNRFGLSPPDNEFVRMVEAAPESVHDLFEAVVEDCSASCSGGGIITPHASA